ncbi:MAG TPA: SPOR domain-containing protein [Casimicrobiaceae bacterium]|nr:SPOR domain-containing protein [Casimicrobiaceae bacterium]
MAPRSDTPEPAVDELRRKARRRLVGAIVLALAAAVALPLLLENEPRPLGEDVSIQIPPVDSGKFVNPLSPGAPENKAKGDKAPALPPPAANAARRIEPPKADASAPAPEAKAPSPQPQPSDAASAVPETKAMAPAPSEPKPVTGETKADAPAAGGAFVVQVAAFSDRYGARSLVAKLKKSGFPGFTETVTTDKGTLHRVRVGPYASREVADLARAKLKAAGFAGVVARSG